MLAKFFGELTKQLFVLLFVIYCRNVMATAVEKGYTSIGLPSLTTGTVSGPIIDAAAKSVLTHCIGTLSYFGKWKIIYHLE